MSRWVGRRHVWGGICPVHGKAGAAQLGAIQSKHCITACTRAYAQVSDFGLSRAVDAAKAASTVLVTNPRWVSHEFMPAVCSVGSAILPLRSRTLQGKGHCAAHPAPPFGLRARCLLSNTATDVKPHALLPSAGGWPPACSAGCPASWPRMCGRLARVRLAASGRTGCGMWMAGVHSQRLVRWGLCRQLDACRCRCMQKPSHSTASLLRCLLVPQSCGSVRRGSCPLRI